MKQLSGCYDLANGELSANSIGVEIHDDSAFHVEIYGRAILEDAVNDAVAVATAFAVHDMALTKVLSGMYLVLIYNKLTKKLVVFQDRATSPIAFYYTVYEDKLFYGTSLKTVLWQSARPGKLNEEALEEFLLNGYIYGEQTLAQGICKIKAFCALTATVGDAAQVAVPYTVAQMTKGEALDAFCKTVDAAILRVADGQEEVNAPLSSGYDSSYIAHVLHEQTALPINAFSIGGKFGKNELPQVKENAAMYERIDLQTALTDENTLQHLPDIVWRLEGNVYENGVFLQYELAKLVAMHQKEVLLCGECADQVFNEHYFQKDRVCPDTSSPQYYEFAEYPYIFGHYLILKKSGIMFNSFGVETRYPYLDDAVVAVAKPLGSLCRKDKRVHTANCSEILPKAVLDNIQKIGGATEVHSLFKDKAAIAKFIKAVEQSEFYRRYADVIARTDRLEAPQTGMAKVKTTVRNTALSALHIGKEGRARDAYYHEEMKLRQYFYYVYVMLFEKLILSGEYAALLGNEGINVSLNELL